MLKYAKSLGTFDQSSYQNAKYHCHCFQKVNSKHSWALYIALQSLGSALLLEASFPLIKCSYLYCQVNLVWHPSFYFIFFTQSPSSSTNVS